MNNIVDIIKNGFYTPLVTALNRIDVMSIEVTFGLGVMQLSEIIAISITLFLIFLIMFAPIWLTIKVIKRLGIL